MNEHIDESIYGPIVEQFSETSIDFEEVGKLIVAACSRLDKGKLDMDKKTIAKNALLLVLGLIHKDEPVDKIGEELWNLSNEEIKTKIDEFKEMLFVDSC